MGPLDGVRVVELAGIGPGPFAAMMLGDLGADVIRVDRVTRTGSIPDAFAVLSARNRRSIAVDLKQSAGRDVVLRLVEDADVLVEGFRPGVAERLGLGPEECRSRNPRLVYGRMTGWGQTGPKAEEAGHDIDYIALTGALGAIGRAAERPVPPLNLVGDNGGGGMLLAVGVLAALVERQTSGRGDVIDAAMVDGAALLMSPIYQLLAMGAWQEDRGSNLLDGGAPFYDTYETADGRAVAVGPLEPQFYMELVTGLGLDLAELPPQFDPGSWPEIRERFAAAFATRSRDEWADHFAGSDACVAPVLDMAEAPHHPHNRARSVFVDVGGTLEPAPAPRFARSMPQNPAPPVAPGAHTDQILAAAGFDAEEIARLHESGAVG
jgi:alpha-methylacyl-CoA racemase